MDRRRWFVYAIPVAVGLAAVVWAIAMPRFSCVSGSDTQVCADQILIKWTIAAVGLVVAAVAGFLAVRSSRASS